MSSNKTRGLNTTSISIISSVLLFAATTAYLLRLLQPCYRKTSLIIGQVVITIALLLLCSLFALTVVLTKLVENGSSTSTLVQKLPFIIDTVTYTQIVVTKFSFALSLLSFSNLNPSLRYRRIISCVVGFQGLYALTIIPLIVRCIPISASWKTTAETPDARCQNMRVAFYTFASLELIDDLILLLLPIPVILALPRKHHRYGAVFLFFLGICVLFADALKMVYIPQDIRSGLQDDSRTVILAFVAHHLKSYLSLIVACMPSARATLGHLFKHQKPRDHEEDGVGLSGPKIMEKSESLKMATSVFASSTTELTMTPQVTASLAVLLDTDAKDQESLSDSAAVTSRRPSSGLLARTEPLQGHMASQNSVPMNDETH